MVAYNRSQQQEVARGKLQRGERERGGCNGSHLTSRNTASSWHATVSSKHRRLASSSRLRVSSRVHVSSSFPLLRTDRSTSLGFVLAASLVSLEL